MTKSPATPKTESDVSVILALDDVHKQYLQGSHTVAALQGLSFEVERGEFTALCDPSGSGKTTALNLIGALDQPTKGSVVLEGQNLSTLSRRELCHLRRDRWSSRRTWRVYPTAPACTPSSHRRTPGTNPVSRRSDTAPVW